MDEDLAPGNRPGDVVGLIRHRLLVNRWVDPDEVTPHLPPGIRPHVGTTGGVIVGCCLIAIDGVRPWPLPAVIGPTIHSAAHRISIEVGPPDALTTAVYVPMRHSNSLVTASIGGRLFPGAHRRSEVTVDYSTDAVRWDVRSTEEREPGRDGDGFGIGVGACRRDAEPTDSEVARIVIGSYLGISPDHRDRLEGAEMRPASMAAQQVTLSELRSDFLDGFASAQEAETLLMTDVGVTWRRASIDGALSN